MPIAASMLPEFDNEMNTTRRMLERVPDAKGEWKPHPKSMGLGALATHIAGMVSWIPRIIADTELDATGPSSSWMRTSWQSAEATLAEFDRGVTAGRAAIASAGDEEMLVPWTLRAGGHVIVSMPRVAILRTLVLNHIIHHRGQLSVYLRLNDVPLPNIYGPTADDVR
jgi:uncharacterized damage-inducible protein DinB